MQKHVLATTLAFAAFASLLACQKPQSSEATTTTAATTAAATTTAAAKPKTKKVDLAPLALTLDMPSDESAMTMDMTIGANKSVSVSFDAVNAGINVSQPIEKSFAEVKKGNKHDTVLFPFKRWVKEGDTTAVEEFTSEGKTGYLALAWKQVGGKSYLCKSNGLSGLKSPEDADKVLAVCDTLAGR
jgi:hypothetical protein